MKVNEITPEIVAEHCRADDYSEEELQRILDASKAYIRSYTGLNDKEIDMHEDLAIAALVLCQDMYDNRSVYVDKIRQIKWLKQFLGCIA